MKIKETLLVSMLALSPSAAWAFSDSTAQPAPQPAGVLGNIRAAAQSLDNAGVRLNVTLLDNFAANPGSGIEPNNAANLAVWGLRADIDLGKLVGWKGATIHQISTLFNFNRNLGFLYETGSNMATLPYFKYHVPYALSLLTLEQKIGPLDVEVGRTNPLRYFWTMNCDDAYTCVPGLVWADTPAMSISYATWGGVVSYHLTPAVYVKGGMFEDNIFNLNTNGFNFRANHATGHLSVAELGSTTSFADAAYPGHYEIGAFDDSTYHANPYLSAYGRPIQLHATDPKLEEHGPIAFFAEGEQTVWRGEANGAKVPPNIALSGAYFHTMNSGQYFTTEAWIGSSFSGFVPGRPLDHFGVRFHYLRLGSDFANYETLSRALAGGSGTQPRDEYAAELSYTAALAPGVSLVPDVQYIINPDTLYYPKSAVAPRDGVVIYANLVVSLAGLLGAPATRP